MSRPLSARERTEWLLRSYREALEDRSAWGNPSGDRSDRLLLRQGLWLEACAVGCSRAGECQSHRSGGCRSSYARLEAALASLRAERPSWYWHVAERYLRSRQRIGEEYRWLSVKGGGKRREAIRVVEETWNPRVDPAIVDRAVAALAKTLDATGGAWLPLQLLEIVAA